MSVNIDKNFMLSTKELFALQEMKVGAECLYCRETGHTGVWDGERFLVCFVCGDKGVLDKKAIGIINFYIEQC